MDEEENPKPDSFKKWLIVLLAVLIAVLIVGFIVPLLFGGSAPEENPVDQVPPNFREEGY